jgi:DNA (cytosine-5)-methyltransferase 1
MIGIRQDLSLTFQWPEKDSSKPVLRDVIGDLPEPVAADAFLPNHHLLNPRPHYMERKIHKNRTGSSLYGCRVMDWNKPSATIMASLAKNVDLAHPGCPPNHEGHHFHNVREQAGYDLTNRRNDWDQPSYTITAHSRSVGLHPNHGPVPVDPENILKLVSEADANGVIPLNVLEATLPTRVQWLKGRQKVGAWHKPNPTITATTSFFTGAHFHPNVARPRRFTVRECARIQSFEDSFVFYGSLSAQYRQVGNAVPPRLAYALARQIAKAFNNNDFMD